MVNHNKKRRGKPSVWAVDESGVDIVGLHIHKPTGRYYSIEKTTDPTKKTISKRIYFGTDFKTAYLKFRRWQQGQSPVLEWSPDLPEGEAFRPSYRPQIEFQSPSKAKSKDR